MHCYVVPEASVNVRRAKVRQERAAGSRTGPSANTPPNSFVSHDRGPFDQMETDDGWDGETFE
jgi:hypothetical protein